MNTYKYTQIHREHAIGIAKGLMVDSIWKEANIELVDGITFPETKEILEGRVPEGMDVEKVIVVNNLKRAWKFLFEQLEYGLSLQTICEYNNIIGSGGLYNMPGVLRQSIVRISGTDYIPQILGYDSVNNMVHNWKTIDNVVDRALTAFCQISKGQWFNNGNKRTAQLVANHILLENSVGIFSISDKDTLEFSKRLVDYYETDDMANFKNWLYDNAVGLLPSGLTYKQAVKAGVDMSGLTAGMTNQQSFKPEVKHRNHKNVRITKEMVRTVYEYAKKVYDNELRRIDAVREVAELSGMSGGSASDYINNYRVLRSSGTLRRQMKVGDIELYLQWIKEDFGAGELASAKKVIENALKYWDTLPTHPNIQKIRTILDNI